MLCSLYLEPDRCGLNWTAPTPVGVDGLLAHLIDYVDGYAGLRIATVAASAWLMTTIAAMLFHGRGGHRHTGRRARPVTSQLGVVVDALEQPKAWLATSLLASH